MLIHHSIHPSHSPAASCKLRQAQLRRVPDLERLAARLHRIAAKRGTRSRGSRPVALRRGFASLVRPSSHTNMAPLEDSLPLQTWSRYSTSMIVFIVVSVSAATLANTSGGSRLWVSTTSEVAASDWWQVESSRSHPGGLSELVTWGDGWGWVEDVEMWMARDFPRFL